MGVIGGIISKASEDLCNERCSKFVDKLNIYKFDKQDNWNQGQVFLTCGIQINTPESKYEVLPYYDYEAGLCITADAIIDNRKELLDLLKIIQADKAVITDSEIILKAYKRWGNSCCNYLIGDFAFAIWDNVKKELFCARDHVGKRSIYYYNMGEQLIFCTVIKPILEIIEEKVELNEKWIADFLTIEGAVHEIEITETVYKNIYQIPPGHYLSVSDKGNRLEKYWFPEKIKILKLKSDEEYIQTFKAIFEEAVLCRLRSAGNIGVSLSGGLDSTAVAAVAARALVKNDGKLEAFTSVPIKRYNDFLPRNLIADESDYINELKGIYNNINLNFCRCDDKNSLTNIEKFIGIMEQPYKMVDNIFWIDEILNKAANKNCKILLDGQFGNFTISYGNFITCIYTLLKKGSFVKVYKEIKGYSEFYGISKKLLTRKIAERILKSIKIFGLISEKKNNTIIKLSPVNPLLSKKWSSQKRAQKLGYNVHSNKVYDFKEIKGFITNLVLFSHMGSLETKHSLATGVIKRDPTRDKRVIEFCLSLPIEQFVKDGMERILIRRAMKDIVPDKIRLNYHSRGKQSADWIQRLYTEWRAASLEINDMLSDETLKSYIDMDRLQRILNNIGTDLSKETYGFQIKTLLVSLVFNKFLKGNVNEF